MRTAISRVRTTACSTVRTAVVQYRTGHLFITVPGTWYILRKRALLVKKAQAEIHVEIRKSEAAVLRVEGTPPTPPSFRVPTTAEGGQKTDLLLRGTIIIRTNHVHQTTDFPVCLLPNFGPDYYYSVRSPVVSTF